jgi:hypothetical protein
MRLGSEAVHYLFSITGDDCSDFDILKSTARSITHLG